MGTYLWSYAVELDRLAEAFGSKNKRLAAKAIAAARVDDNTKFFVDQIAAGAPTLDRAITEIIDGKLTARKHAFQYAYALEAICGVLGKRAGDELKVTGWIEQVLDPQLAAVKAKCFCRLMHLHAVALPVKIPGTDSPFCSSMKPAEVATAAAAFQRLAARMEETPPDWQTADGIGFVLTELRARLKAAGKTRGLVHFMY